jgi:hypothetical protein
MGIRLTFCLFLTSSVLAFGQSRTTMSKALKPEYLISWSLPGQSKISDFETVRFLSFDGAQYAFSDGFLPRYFAEVPVNPNDQQVTVALRNETYLPLSDEESALIKDPSKITSEVKPLATVGFHKKKAQAVVTFIPIRKNPGSGKFEKLVSFDLETVSSQTRNELRAPHTYAANSVLQSGDWYKIAVLADGIYKIDYAFFVALGIDVNSISPENIRIYGNGGGMLAASNAVNRPDDLLENAIFVSDGSDNSFDINDYVLFYGQGPHRWKTGTGCSTFEHITNIYSDTTFYFLNVDLGPGKRIQSQASASAPATHTLNTFNDRAFHENESVNFIKSGNQWFGEYFDNIASYNFSFSFPNIDGSSLATVKANLASRYIGGGLNANYSVTCQSGFGSMSVPPTAGDSYSPYANLSSTCFSFNPTSSNLTVTVNKLTSDAVAWMDYVEVNVRRQLTMNGSQMLFRDLSSVGAGNVAQFNLTSSQPVQVWDVSDPDNVASQVLSNAGTLYQFAVESDSLREFISFTGTSFLDPIASMKVPNQNLHAIAQKEFIIVAHPDFMDEAIELAAHHENHDTLSTTVVTPQQIYNEFSSGAQDPVAIRHFVKMFYDRAASASDMPRYLLLFGDGSYDNKKRFGNSNTNFIPTYQSDNSTIYTESYVSDDYYGLLDDNEGLFLPIVPSNEYVDIGIGRFPVKTKAEARVAVDKIFKYTKTGIPPSVENNNSCLNVQTATPFGDWRNIVCFIGDDEDGGLHQGSPPSSSGAEQLAVLVDTTYNDYNVDKIYLDAYPQASTPGGERYPDVNDAINKRVEKGALIVNYTGHGGEVGLAHERVVEVAQINKWANINALPLFFTATCEFSRYDDPERTSAGEYVFLNPNGGGIALMTTVRLVFASPNFTVNKNFFKSVFVPIAGVMPRLGDLYEYMKDQPGGNYVNSRNFTLLGDPALTLAYPKYDVATDSVNHAAVTASSSDTLRALTLVTVSGHLKDGSGAALTGYNGVLYPTVYDKSQSITTLSNDGPLQSPPFTFKLQKNILYKGKVSVTDGKFTFSFVVPKDIAYAYGIGRISYYAENGSEDANGYYEKVIIGGSNDSALADNAGPEVKLFMNDDKFVFGGLTDENPELFAKLKDEYGVNTVGNGIGHDITAVMDGNTDDVIVLNDYYQADLNSYKSGSIRYPFSELSEGKHTLSLKVWDVYNNSSQSYTEFVVSKSAELALDHVLNYPNPFTTKTQFFFEQNRCCQTLEVQLQVFTVSGKLVKNISKFVQAEGYRSDPIEWDGRDDFGDKIGKGVYIYKLRVKADDGSAAEKFEKLVILN